MVALSKEHSYVLLGAIASTGVIWYMAGKVGMARKKFGIHLPIMYADNETEDGKKFNCIQRAHQNTLEVAPTYFFFLGCAGLKYPVYAASCAGLWTVGRIMFARGYYTGNPKNRHKGDVSALGYFGLIGATGYWAIKTLCKECK